MAWRRIGDKPLSEPMLTRFTDALGVDELNMKAVLSLDTALTPAPHKSPASIENRNSSIAKTKAKHNKIKCILHGVYCIYDRLVYIYTHAHAHAHTHTHTNIHTYIHTYIHICWFNFDALAQGNAYKPTKEPYIHTYIFVVVNFDALAQASDFRIERRQVVFLCWEQDSNPGPQTPIRQQTECSLTNRLSYRGSSLKLELDSPSLWSARIQPTWPHCQLTFAPGSGDIHICCC